MKQKLNLIGFCLLALFVLFALFPARAQERILSYDSVINVARDGSLSVTETIQVRAEGVKIRHGIFRDFPQLYRHDWGLVERRLFAVDSVTRNGQPEPWRLQPEAAGTRIWIGDADTELDSGSIQTYQIQYHTTRQLIFGKDRDELRWNVTGNEWSFPIMTTQARVILPAEITPLELDANTGYRGEEGKDFTVSKSGNDIVFQSTRAFASGDERSEGLTIRVFWAAGALDAVAYEKPAISEENWLLFWGWKLMGLSLFVYIVAWFVVGRDPRKGVIIPRWEPPDGWSPAAVRYLKIMGFDNQIFSAGVISLAAKKCLSIQGTLKSDYLLKRALTTQKIEPLTDDEEALYAGLFNGKRLSSLPLDQEHHSIVQLAQKALKNALKAKNRRRWFRVNLLWWLPGLLLSLAGLALIVANQPDGLNSLGGTQFILVMGALSWFMWHKAISACRPVFQWESITFFVMGSLFSVFFLVILVAIPDSRDLVMIACLLLIVFMSRLFFRLMKTPTREGRRILDEIDGFREYLSVAEEDRLNLENPPEKTPELFEKFLPYALALDVEQQWCRKFDSVLKAAATSPGSSGDSNLVHFYTSDSQGLSSFSSGAIMGAALTSALTSAAVAPSSSSGGSGGGGSGGGGGGGGGGGW